MYKILKDIAPGYLRELFTHVNEDNEYNLRSSDINVKIPQPFTEYLKRIVCRMMEQLCGTVFPILYEMSLPYRHSKI